MRITLNPTTQAQKRDIPISRRNFLGLAFAGSLAALVGQGLAATLKFLQPPKVAGFGGLVLAGKVEDFLLGSVTRVMAGRFYILHNQDGLLAIYQKCTHLGCSVPWVEGEGQFHCPCHGSLFNRNGEVIGGPAPRPLEIFRIEVKNGEVWVDTSKPVNRSAYDPSQSVRV